ncbi:MAG: hypothetical protein EXR20_06105 [Bacteroidetes bacterium]|jgi:hypothetical protein|nr:hypothetical protein [Bacteroidota bacterium]
MAKFRITKDFSFGTYVPKRSGMPTRKVNFKKGDILEGSLINNENKGAVASDIEAPQFFETQTAQGKVRIPYGFRGEPFIEAMSTPETIEGNEGPKPKVNPNTTETPVILTKTNEATETKWFTTKNIVIGVLVIVAIYVFLKWKKMI